LVQDHRNIQNLLNTSLDEDDDIWNKYFKDIFTKVIKDLTSSGENLRDIAIQTLTTLSNTKPGLIKTFDIEILRMFFEQKINHIKYPGQHRKKGKEKILSQFDLPLAIEKMVPSIAKYDALSIRIFNKILPLLSISQLESLLDNSPILEILYKGIEEKDSLIRRGVVMSVVSIFRALGEKYTKYTNRLSESQLRLIQYFKKKEESK